VKLTFEVRFTLAAKKPSTQAGELVGLFGMDPEQGERVYVPQFDLNVEPGQIVLFSGASGAGKTSCLRQFQRQTGAADIDDTPVLDKKKGMLVDQLGDDVAEGVKFASMAGLAEAQLFLRHYDELSDGQRYRFRIARTLAAGAQVLVADEFCATLDRVTAKTIAFNLRKLVTRNGLILAVATTHTDLIEDLAADHVVTFDSRGAQIGSRRPLPPPTYGTGASASTTSLPLRAALEATGGGLLSGTTGVTTSASRKRRGSSRTTKKRSASASSARRR
jgi:ABC-type ATPase with predicted acetyltransferase domain